MCVLCVPVAIEYRGFPIGDVHGERGDEVAPLYADGVSNRNFFVCSASQCRKQIRGNAEEAWVRKAADEEVCRTIIA